MLQLDHIFVKFKIDKKHNNYYIGNLAQKMHNSSKIAYLTRRLFNNYYVIF